MTILAVLTIPSLENFYSLTKARVLQSQLLQEIDYAREAAYDRRLSVGLCPSGNQHTCTDNWMEGKLVFIDEEDKQILKVIPPIFNQGYLHFRAYPAYLSYLLFLPRGFSQENGSFWYCISRNSTPSWAIILNQSGRARVQYPDSSGVIKDAQGKKLLCN